MFKDNDIVKDTFYNDRETIIVDSIKCIAKHSVRTPQDYLMPIQFTYKSGRLQHYTIREQKIRELYNIIIYCKIHSHLYKTIDNSKCQIYDEVLKESEIKLALMLK